MNPPTSWWALFQMGRRSGPAASEPSRNRRRSARVAANVFDSGMIPPMRIRIHCSVVAASCPLAAHKLAACDYGSERILLCGETRMFESRLQTAQVLLWLSFLFCIIAILTLIWAPIVIGIFFLVLSHAAAACGCYLY